MQALEEWFSARAAARAQFLNAQGWRGAQESAIGDDMAFRRYIRLRRGDGATIMLMEALPDTHPHATPGHRIGDYIRISRWLREKGVAAPAVHAADEQNGFVLIEDFGDVSFKAALEQGREREGLYTLATDVLSLLRAKTAAPDIALPGYYQSHVHTGRRRVVDWYMPLVRRARNPDGLAEDYLAVWASIEKKLAPAAQGFLHIDYHFENLMWRPAQSGLSQCGVLDFQGAMYGPAPYDLANLLEDVRVDVPADLRQRMMTRYLEAAPADARENFRQWYRVLATQYHCRVIGQFIKLVQMGKPRYLAHMPRVARYLREGLKDPLLAPLRVWFAEQGVDFTVEAPALDHALIREDAF